MNLQIGWSSCDITPEQPVFVHGQFNSRISEGVLDPVTATILALESSDSDFGGVIMVSCDLVSIPRSFYSAIRTHTLQLLPELNPENIIINATHTHTAPQVSVGNEHSFASYDLDDMRAVDNGVNNIAALKNLENNVMNPADYIEWAALRIAEAIVKAWQSRKAGGIAYGLGHAVVGHNRCATYYNGESQMYGDTSDAQFSHIEGYEDHSVNILYTWNMDRQLTGIVVNVACPAQDSESLSQISADYWHDTRQELHKRLGSDVFVMAQPSSAGDQSPHLLLYRAAEQRMWKLMGRTHREDIALSIADAVTNVLPYVEKEIDWKPVFRHKVETVNLPRRMLGKEDVDYASAESARTRKAYDELIAEYKAHPESHHLLEWYSYITCNYRMMNWNERVIERYSRQQQMENTMPVELHALRIGDIAMTTSPFEYYLDFGLQIKAHSKAIQTFVVQLAGDAPYLPTERGVAGRSYGAVAASTTVGPDGGRKLAEWAVDTINAFFE